MSILTNNFLQTSAPQIMNFIQFESLPYNYVVSLIAAAKPPHYFMEEIVYTHLPQYIIPALKLKVLTQNKCNLIQFLFKDHLTDDLVAYLKPKFRGVQCPLTFRQHSYRSTYFTYLIICDPFFPIKPCDHICGDECPCPPPYNLFWRSLYPG